MEEFPPASVGVSQGTWGHLSQRNETVKFIDNKNAFFPYFHRKLRATVNPQATRLPKIC